MRTCWRTRPAPVRRADRQAPYVASAPLGKQIRCARGSWRAGLSRYAEATLREIEIEFVVKGRVDCVRWTHHEQHIAVSGRAHDGLGADVAAGARAIFNDELLTQPLRQPLPDEPRGTVRRAGWSDRHDQAQPAATDRPALSRCATRPAARQRPRPD